MSEQAYARMRIAGTRKNAIQIEANAWGALSCDMIHKHTDDVVVRLKVRHEQYSTAQVEAAFFLPITQARMLRRLLHVRIKAIEALKQQHALGRVRAECRTVEQVHRNERAARKALPPAPRLHGHKAAAPLEDQTAVRGNRR